MNEKELKVEMLRHDDTMETLAVYLGVSKATVCRKVSGENNFRSDEMLKIKHRYALTTERFMEIFYGEGVNAQ